jgi:N-acyl homoserine lactone hydrolase
MVDKEIDTITETLVASISLFNVGTLRLDQSVLTYRRGLGTPVDVPVTVGFIEMQDGEHILFDTGMLPADHEGRNGAETLPFYRKDILRYMPEDDLRCRLAEIGRTPADVKIVVNSHFHWDHSGGNVLFPHARFYAQASEHRFACQPDPFVGRLYSRPYFECGVAYEYLVGDTVIKPGVATVATPGHTPGHQSLLVRLPSGRSMIFTGDSMVCPANLDPAIPPGNAHNFEAAISSIQRLKMLSEFLSGDLVICHDPEFWKKWCPAPYRYR